LVKPFTARELLARVDAHLRLAKMRKEAAALHESELRFRSMADCVPVMMWTCGTERLCDYFNQGWLDFTGRSEEQEANDGWRAGIHPDDLPQLLAQFDSAFATRRTFSLEYRLRRHDGHYRWMLGITAPRLLPNGTFLGYIMSCIDISERKEAEKQVRELNENLEARVAERTAQLTTANHDLEAFSYSVSHDLRAPLRHISGFATILVQEHGQQLDQPGQECLKSISEAATRMGQLIDGLLEMGRLDRQQISRKPTDLNPLVQEVVRELQELWNGRDLEWRIGALPILECDPSLIKCVFTNLLSNAIKYTRRKQRAIIEVGHQIVGGKAVLFIRDNGAGFDQRYAGKLFGVFQRLHKMEEFEGMGIGLATVQRIIQRHGGRVWAEAEINKGATFSFYCRAA
jgi:PAS domain S-box-containing protein